MKASFYQPPNIPDTFSGDEMHSSPISTGTSQEKGRIECLLEFQIFYPGIIAQIFEEKYLLYQVSFSKKILLRNEQCCILV